MHETKQEPSRRWPGMRERLVSLPAVARAIQTVLGIAASLRDDPITLRAAALTYLTLLSLVPLLAVVFSIFQAVVGTHELEARLQEFILQNLAVGVQGNVSHYLTQYIQRATSFGVVGFAFLVFSSISLMKNVEAALNHTFRAPRPRPLALRFGVYWCLLTLGPILLALSLAATAIVQSAHLVWLGPVRHALFLILPGGITVTAFTLVYAIVPAVPVKRRAALTGALVAGIAWECAKIVYAAISARSVRTGAIYGSLSAIPIFLVWAYLSWIIMLFGARVAYAVQAGYLAVGAPSLRSPLGRELFVAQVMCGVAAPFANGKEPPSAKVLAIALHSQEADVLSALRCLEESGLAHGLPDGLWVPARPLEQILLSEVRRAARGASDVRSLAPDLERLRDHWQAADDAAARELDVSVADLVRGTTSLEHLEPENMRLREATTTGA